VAALAQRGWPGNVRELANALERAVILADGDELGPELFAPEPIKGARREAPAPARLPTMEEAERDAIQRALLHFDGNRKKTAEHLGIGLRTLYEKLQRYGLG